jgi:hypothetical protein
VAVDRRSHPARREGRGVGNSQHRARASPHHVPWGALRRAAKWGPIKATGPGDRRGGSAVDPALVGSAAGYRRPKGRARRRFRAGSWPGHQTWARGVHGRRSSDTARFRLPASGRATQDLSVRVIPATRALASASGEPGARPLARAGRMRRTPEQRPVSTSEGPRRMGRSHDRRYSCGGRRPVHRRGPLGAGSCGWVV